MKSASKRPLHVVYVTLFLYFLSVSFTTFINSSFLSDGCGCGIAEKNIGLIFTVGAFIALILLSELPKLALRYGNYNVIMSLLTANTVALIGIIFIRQPYILSLLIMGFLSLNVITLMNFDIFIEEYSSKSDMGDSRGIFATLTHTALIGALIATGFLIDSIYGYHIVYAISAILSLIALGIIASHKKIFLSPVYQKPASFFRTVHAFWKDTNLRKIFLASYILQFFFAVMVIYTPIYLNRHIGIAWEHIGIILALMLLPFIFFSIPLGILADKKYGEKEILGVGFFVIAFFTGMMSFVTTPHWWIWALLLFGTRIGATAVQVMTETYFFKHVKESQIGLISVFRDANPLAYITAPLFATLMLTVFDIPIQYMFIILALVTLLGLRYSTSLHDTK